MATQDIDPKILLSALDSLQGRAGFCSSGGEPFFFPGLTVDGLGEIAFQLPGQQAAAFISLAEAAPYGKGTETEYDEEVRKCWQIDAKDFRFGAKAWDDFLSATLVKVREDLGITGRISAQPYKLLLYGPGGHFKAHRDTEKLDAMFGTLIIALPSSHEGGQLHIRHGGEEKTVDFSAEARRHDLQHAAFFADCEHEVVPVERGFRFCAVFNLVLEDGDPEFLNQDASDHARPLAMLLEKFTGVRPPAVPTVILLEHQYTEANFSLSKLKGQDRQKAAALFAAAGHAGLTARLALATFHQTGELEDGYDYGSRYRRGSRGHENPDTGTMGEVYEESFGLEHWRDAGDRKLSLGRFEVNSDEVITAEDFSATDPDEKAGEGYTGNAGCTMEYWYRRAAVVLWPEGSEEEIQCAQNLPEACASLLTRSSDKKTGDGTPFDKLARAAIPAIAADFDSNGYRYSHIDKETTSPLCRMLRALSRAKRRDLLDESLRTLEARAFGIAPQDLWKELLETFGPDTFASTFEEMLADEEGNREVLFNILAALNTREQVTDWSSRIAAKTSRLKHVPAPHWQSSASRDPEPPGNISEFRILFAAAPCLTERKDIAAAFGFLKSDSSLFAVRKLIAPLFTVKESGKGEVACELLAFCKDTLASEIARPIVPYPDWRRPCPPPEESRENTYYGNRSNNSEVLRELATFMADPDAREHPIRRRQDERTEAEGFIKRQFLDLDCHTIEKSRPYTLHCTKNDRSHQHALEWRRKDEEMLVRLGRM